MNAIPLPSSKYSRIPPRPPTKTLPPSLPPSQVNKLFKPKIEAYDPPCLRFDLVRFDLIKQWTAWGWDDRRRRRRKAKQAATFPRLWLAEGSGSLRGSGQLKRGFVGGGMRGSRSSTFYSCWPCERTRRLKFGENQPESNRTEQFNFIWNLNQPFHSVRKYSHLGTNIPPKFSQ